MGINWGIALGSAAQSGLNTYSKLNEEIRLAEEAERKKQEFEWKAQEQRDAQAIKDLNASTYGNIGTQDYTQAIKTEGGVGSQQAKALNVMSGDADFDKAVAESTTNALRGNAGQAPVEASALQGTAYTDRQAASDFRAGLAKAKIDPLKAAQITTALRAEREGQKKEAMQDFHDDFNENLRKGNLKSAAEMVLPLYNDNIPGTHGADGLKGKLVMDKEKGLLLEQTNADGKVVGTVPITQKYLEDNMEKIMFAKYKSLDYAKGTELGYKKEELGLKSREVGVKEARLPAENAKDYGAANYYNANSERFRAMADNFEEKLPEGQKIILNSRKDSLKAAEKAYADNPTDATAAAVKAAQFKLYNTYSNLGLKGIDPHKEANVPVPADAASKLIAQKVKPKDLEKNLAVIANTYGEDYAKQLKTEYDKLKAQPAPGKENPAKPEKPASAIPASATGSKQKEFYETKLEQRKKALEGETNPRRKATISAEVAKLEAMLAK